MTSIQFRESTEESRITRNLLFPLSQWLPVVSNRPRRGGC